MDKKPVILVLILALVLVLYVGFMAAPQVTTSPVAQGEVRLEVTGPAAVASSTEGQVTLVVV